MNLLPRDEKFFDLFSRQAGILCKASSLLVTGARAGYAGVRGIAPEMKAIEREGDEITHEISRKLQTTFLTPFDPEDVQALATALDEVVDYIDNATYRIVAYRLDPVLPEVVQLAEMVAGCCQSLARAIESLRAKRSVLEDCIEVHRLENEADTLERAMVAHLFTHETDAIALLKRKEVYEVLEATTDRCEDVADVIQNVAVKQS
jgi:predicted phosphate transport protein (TIGR00153 family)